MPPITYDVAVVGAGPAGSVAAARLAGAGLRVALIDKAALPRYKTCGGGVVGRALQHLPGDVSPVVVRECRTAELSVLDQDLHFACRRPQPIVSMTMRDRLDHLLAETAVAAGATLLAPLEVRGLRVDSVCRLATSAGELMARFVVAADGATGPVGRAAGWSTNARAIPALEYEIGVDALTFQRFAGSAQFDFGVIPHGYAWVFPKESHLSAGVLSTRRGPVQLQSHLDQYLRRLGITPVGDPERHGYVIPTHPLAGDFVRNRTLLVGDAAGFVDPVTAEGISFAALSGRLAAEAIVQGGLEEPLVRRLYHASLAAEVLSELRAARQLARVLYDWPWLSGWVFRTRGRMLAEGVTDVMMGTRTYRSALTRPLNYLRLALRR